MTTSKDVTVERHGPYDLVFLKGEQVGMLRRYSIGNFTGHEINDGMHGWERLPGKQHEVKREAILALCIRAMRRQAGQRDATQLGMEAVKS